MVVRRPLVNISGQTTELPPGDSVVGGSVGTLTAGSGLNGGGDLSSVVTTNISLAPNPSGLLFADGKLGVDGVAGVTASTAFASGNFSLGVGIAALASGVAGSQLAATALASGTAALADINAIPGGTIETFTAASAVASGHAVGLDDGGKVQSVRAEVNVDSLTVGSPAVFNSATSYWDAAVYASASNKVAIFYRDDGNLSYGTCVIATVNGLSVTYGTPVVFKSGNLNYISPVYDSVNDKVVISYRDNVNSSYGTSIVGTISGSTISFGSPAVFESATTIFVTSVYDTTNQKVVNLYTDATNASYGTAVVGTVSGTSISFGTPVVFSAFDSLYIVSTYDSTNSKVVTSYYVNGSGVSYSIVGTVSGTSISFGTRVTLVSSPAYDGSAAFDSTSSKVIKAYADGNNSNYGTVKIGTVSGTSISYGSPVIFRSATVSLTSTVYNTQTNRVVIAYGDGGNSYYGTFIVGTVSGTSITFATPIVFNSTDSYYISSVYNSTDNVIVTAYNDVNNANAGTSVAAIPNTTIQPSISSQNNFIGIAQTTAASGSAVQVRLPGSYDQNNTGLTPGAVYYVNPTTSGFTTTATQPTAWSGAVNWAPIGRAVNSTTLLLTDMI